MDDQQVQQDHTVPLPFVISIDVKALHLPPDFVKTIITWQTVAEGLVDALPDVPDEEFLAQVVDALGEIDQTIDNAVESIDLTDALLPKVSHLIYYQSRILQLRHLLLRDINDLRRAIYIMEVLPQFCDPADAEFPQHISRNLNILFRDAFVLFITPFHPSKITLSQMFESFGVPFDFMTRAKSIVNLADNASQIKAEVRDCNPRSQIIRDLDWVVTTAGSVVQHCNPSDGGLEAVARLLIVQLVVLQARFRLLGNIADLDRSTYISEITPQFCITPSDLSHSDLHQFAFTSNEPSEYLSSRIAIGEELLCHPHEDTWLRISTKLALLLNQRCQREDSIVDRERILQLCKESLPSVTGEYRAGLLLLGSHALSCLSELGQQLPDLSWSLQFFDECPSFSEMDKARFLWGQLRNAAVSGDERAAVSALHEIHTRDYARYEAAVPVFSGESEADALFIIQKLRQMCAARSQEDILKPFAIILVIALLELHNLQGDTRYLREAISVRSRLGPPGSYGFDDMMYGMATITNFDYVEKRSDFVKMRATGSRGFVRGYPEMSEEWKHSPGKREGAGTWHAWILKSLRSETLNVTDLGIHKLRKNAIYLQTGDEWDFHMAHREFLLQLSDPQQRRRALNDLGFLHATRYSLQNDIKDLDQAIYYHQQAIDTLREDEQTRDPCLWRSDWADCLFCLHEATNSVERSRLLQAHDYYRQAAAAVHYVPIEFRLECIEKWMDHLPKLEEDRMVHASDVLELALSLLEEQSWEASGPRFSIDTRHEKKLLGHSIAHLALQAGVYGRVMTKGIEVIEASQALVWKQLRRLRVPLDKLTTVSPELASEFQQLSRLLESRTGLLDANTEGHIEPFGTNNWQLNQDMSQIIDKIRALPGFENFLQRRAFGEDVLCELTKDGPVVMLLGSGEAILLHQNRIDSFTLPVTFDALYKLHKSFRSTAKARDTHDGSEFAEEPIDISTHPVAGPSNPRAGMKVERNKASLRLEDLLEVLWRRVVEPVLEKIFGHSNRGGKSKTWEIPKLEDRPRIWWCCLGEFSFFPIHAAGIYSGGSPICLSDFFVSSYTPTLTALLDARERPIPSEIKILAAAQPNPGRGWNKLNQVEDELREIVQAAPPTHLISLGDTDQPDFEGHHTTVENVLKKLPEASVLHLACHGTQDTRDPLRSGFILANAKRLTIEELIQYRLPNAHTAILSACHTASNDAEQPEEAINLSSALMFLGFSNILATKWPMNDNDGPIIAKAVYKALFDTTQQRSQSPNDPADSQVSLGTESAGNGEHSPTLESFSLARVVDGVARRLRLEKKPATRWATFVHIGI